MSLSLSGWGGGGHHVIWPFSLKKNSPPLLQKKEWPNSPPGPVQLKVFKGPSNLFPHKGLSIITIIEVTAYFQIGNFPQILTLGHSIGSRLISYFWKEIEKDQILAEKWKFYVIAGSKSFPLD